MELTSNCVRISLPVETREAIRQLSIAEEQSEAETLRQLIDYALTVRAPSTRANRRRDTK